MKVHSPFGLLTWRKAGQAFPLNTLHGPCHHSLSLSYPHSLTLPPPLSSSSSSSSSSAPTSILLFSHSSLPPLLRPFPSSSPRGAHYCCKPWVSRSMTLSPSSSRSCSISSSGRFGLVAPTRCLDRVPLSLSLLLMPTRYARKTPLFSCLSCLLPHRLF